MAPTAEAEPDRGEGTARPPGAEVKTLTFVTLRAFLPEYLGAEAYAALRRGLPRDALRRLDEAESGGWAPEAELQSILYAVHAEALRGNDEAFVEFARGLAAVGISRFMRIFLSLASERFVLRKVPVVWDRLRRNAGTVRAEVEPGSVALHYERFPFFGTPVGRLVSLANCQALVLAATDRLPRGRIVAWTEDTLQLRFDLGVEA
ncbi:MAG: hypothetical protein AAF721_18580 [Myxococcota bacterium]